MYTVLWKDLYTNHARHSLIFLKSFRNEDHDMNCNNFYNWNSDNFKKGIHRIDRDLIDFPQTGLLKFAVIRYVFHNSNK